MAAYLMTSRQDHLREGDHALCALDKLNIGPFQQSYYDTMRASLMIFSVLQSDYHVIARIPLVRSKFSRNILLGKFVADHCFDAREPSDDQHAINSLRINPCSTPQPHTSRLMYHAQNSDLGLYALCWIQFSSYSHASSYQI